MATSCAEEHKDRAERAFVEPEESVGDLASHFFERISYVNLNVVCSLSISLQSNGMTGYEELGNVMSDPQNDAYQRDLRQIEGLVSGWHLAAAPITAVLGLFGLRIISNIVGDWEITRDIIFWLFEVVPGDDLETKRNFVVIITAGTLLLVSLSIVQGLVGFFIGQRILSRVNITPFPMDTVADMAKYTASHSNGQLRERFYFVSRGERTARADSTNVGHRGSMWAAIGYSIIGLVLVGLANQS